jgi:hypothetical protein
MIGDAIKGEVKKLEMRRLLPLSTPERNQNVTTLAHASSTPGQDFNNVVTSLGHTEIGPFVCLWRSLLGNDLSKLTGPGAYDEAFNIFSK